MNKTMSLAVYEFKGHSNWKSDSVALLLILLVIAARLVTVDWVNKSNPISASILYSENHQFLNTDLQNKLEEFGVAVEVSGDKLNKELSDGDIDAYFEFCLDCDVPTLKVHSVDEFVAFDFANRVKELITPKLVPYFYGIDTSEYEKYVAGVKLEVIENSAKRSESYVTINTAYMILTCIGMLTAFAFLLQGITAEKDSKVTLMYVSCMAVKNWVDAKVIAALGVSLKNLVLYIVLCYLGLTYAGFITLSKEELIAFVINDIPMLMLVFVVGIIFWGYFFALVSVLMNNPNSPVKNAAVMLPMTAFGVVLAISDYISSDIYYFVASFPLTYFFSVSTKIILTDIGFGEVLIYSVITLLASVLLRYFAIRLVKFEG